jgi:hypothetical protein
MESIHPANITRMLPCPLSCQQQYAPRSTLFCAKAVAVVMSLAMRVQAFTRKKAALSSGSYIS